MPSIPERVAKGAALLDEKLPGWHERIDLDRLDMWSSCNCVLGQTWDRPVPLYSTPYETHYDVLFPDLVTDNAYPHGFDGKSRLELKALTDEWRRVILARRGGAQ